MEASRTSAASPLADAVPSGHAALETVGYLRSRSRRPLRARSRADVSWALTRLTIDALMLAAAAVAASFGAGAAGLSMTPSGWTAAFAAIALGILHARGEYATGRNRLIDDVLAAAVAAGISGFAILALRLAFEPRPELLGETVRLSAYGAAYVIAGRALLAWSDAEVRLKRWAGTPTLIVGAGVAARIAAERLAEHPTLGLRPIGFLDEPAREISDGIPVLGAPADLERVAKANGVRHVVITPSSARYEELLALVERCEGVGVRISFLPGSGGP